MKCYRCGQEVREHSYGCYTCEHCGFAIHDLVYRQYPKDLGFGFVQMPNSPEPTVYQQGWVCPKCGGVYAPYQCCCPNCTPARPIQCSYGTGTAGKPNNNFTITTSTGFTDNTLSTNYNFDVKSNGTAQPKRGRGRPRIHPVKTEKRPVGRPRKVVNK